MKLQLDKESFLKFFNINDIDIKEKSFLCAVSGGVDSMVLYDLMIKSNVNFSVASCNYKSRKESMWRVILEELVETTQTQNLHLTWNATTST